MSSLGIAIAGGRFVRINSKIGDMPHNVRLRTLKGGQRTAKLEFHAFSRKGSKLLKTHQISLRGANSEGPVELRLRIERLSSAVWVARVGLPAGGTEEIRLRTGLGPWLFIAAGLLLLAGLAAAVLTLGGGTAAGLFKSTGPSTSRESVSSTSAAVLSSENVSREATVVAQEAAPSVSASDGTSGSDASDEAPESRSQDTDAATDAADAISETGISSSDTDTVIVEGETSSGGAADVIVDFKTVVVYFPPDSAILNPKAVAVLNQSISELPSGTRLRVIGHCAGYGTERGRRILSLARARVVAEYIAAESGDSIEYDVFGFGYDEPATRDPDRQDLNRRVEVSAE